MRTLLLFSVLAIAGCDNAQADPPPMIKTLSEALADNGSVLGTGGLSWPDGRQAVVLYIKADGGFYRCLDYFDAGMTRTGSLCLSMASDSIAGQP